MKKGQIVLISSALLLFAQLSFLPKNNVDNDGGVVANKKEDNPVTSEKALEEHLEIPSEAKKELDSLVLLHKQTVANETTGNYIPQIVNVYIKFNRFDSAAQFVESTLDENSDWDNRKLVGDLYYDAFTYAVKADKSEQMAKKARYFYEDLLKEEPDSLNLQVKIGMTLVSSENPMQGILKIREVLDKQPNNRLALLNLGILSMKSGQFDKAIGRFQKLLELDSSDVLAQFYLGISYFESNEHENAHKIFNQIKAQTTDPNILQTVDEYLKKLDAQH